MKSDTLNAILKAQAEIAPVLEAIRRDARRFSEGDGDPVVWPPAVRQTIDEACNRASRYLADCELGAGCVGCALIRELLVTLDRVMALSSSTLRFVQRVAAHELCDDDGKKPCCGDSGPYCQTHDLCVDDQVLEARALLGQSAKEPR